jgi:histidinol dehydrogenase
MASDWFIGPEDNHRLDREAGALIYPVYSRRSKGLSVGINLFPDRKVCSFDCPYCEVFPFHTDIRFSLEAMERGLRSVANRVSASEVRDLSFSGNGEPTLSPDFPKALELAFRLRNELFPAASLVLITNGSTLLDPGTFELLRSAAMGEAQSSAAAGPRPVEGLDIWLKVDAGTEGWFRKIDRSSVPFGSLMKAFHRFASLAPLTIQTMLCAIGGEVPGPQEARAWQDRVLDLVAAGSAAQARMERDGGSVAGGRGFRSQSLAPVTLVRRVHLYGKARPAPEDPLAQALPVEYLEERAQSLRQALKALGYGGPGEGPTEACVEVEVFP